MLNLLLRNQSPINMKNSNVFAITENKDILIDRIVFQDQFLSSEYIIKRNELKAGRYYFTVSDLGSAAQISGKLQIN